PAEAEAPAAEGEAVEYEYVEAPAEGEAVEYEYVEAPAETEAPAAEGEAVEYEYVEAPAEAEAPAAAEGEASYATDTLSAEGKSVGIKYPEDSIETETPAKTTEKEEVPSVSETPEEETEAPATEASAPAETEQNDTEEQQQPIIEAPLPEPVAPVEDKETTVEAEDLEAVEETAAETEYEPVADAGMADELEVIDTPVKQNQPEDSSAVEATAVTAVAGTAAIDALAEKAAEEAAQPENDAEIVAEEAQEELDPQEESDMLPATGAYSFDGTQSASFTGSDVMDRIILINDSHAFDRLNEWYLLISEFSVTPLSDQNGAEVPLSDEVFCQGAFIDTDGTNHPFANETLLTVPSNQTNLALCGIKVMPLAEQANATIELSDSSGILIGTGGVQLMFSHVNKITVPDAGTVSVQTAPRSGALVYDSSRPAEKKSGIFTFTASDGTAETESENILIKTGYSLYGWNVAFANGQTMSLADVRTYQTKHASLPDTDGTIRYGEACLTFKNAKRISVYEKPSYCGYGQKPE
ncbi:MAG: hypothetical protein IKR09_01950, partial [Alphaproteobacteria bacterium]|nr:hypothetical protein [Alphaproteobacteria bacterium]